VCSLLFGYYDVDSSSKIAFRYVEIKHMSSKPVYEPRVQGHHVAWLRLNCKNSKLLALIYGVHGIPRDQTRLVEARTNNPTTTWDFGGCNHRVVPTHKKHAKELCRDLNHIKMRQRS